MPRQTNTYDSIPVPLPPPHLQAGAEALLEDVQVSGIENKLQRLLPVGQGETGAERVHQQAADLHPEGVPTRPQDPPPLVVRSSSSTGAALQGGIEGKAGLETFFYLFI